MNILKKAERIGLIILAMSAAVVIGIYGSGFKTSVVVVIGIATLIALIMFPKETVKIVRTLFNF